ncbi:MAG: glycosyltransferase family 2 protein [Chloroflexi bacterium]|nr:glycosyltransferase family 2 protein [Chloroflexota bacterium]
MSSLTIDVVICTRNRGSFVNDTLHSLQENHRKEFQVFVVDQSTDGGTIDIISNYCKRDDRFHYILSPTQGLNIAHNIGVNCGIGDVIAFIDDDCRADPEWLDALLREYEQDPEACAVFGRIFPEKAIDLLKPRHKWEDALPMAMIDHTERRIYQKNRFNLGFGHGANMSITRNALKKIGMFDELLGAGGWLRSFPERDLGYRILLAGGKIIYTSQAMVYHNHWREWNDVKRTHQNYAIGVGAAVGKYLRKGDLAAILILLEWFWSQGFRQMASGVLRWGSWQKFMVGWYQIIYPFVGLKMGSQYKLSDQFCVYLGPDEQTKS